MAIVITLLSVSFVLAVVTAILLSAAIRNADSSPAVRKIPQPDGVPRFFAADIPVSVHGVSASRVPVEVLLLEIERHVKVEREVAEAFHLSPNPQSLHVQAARPLMH
ncbi:MAG TPA: hypothetical protein VH740_19800 [Vicinamibacterales bacterium]|jgi:hypothetical protein